eukprot:7799415-Alexandrium_andersonii.AAC.1
MDRACKCRAFGGPASRSQVAARAPGKLQRELCAGGAQARCPSVGRRPTDEPEPTEAARATCAATRAATCGGLLAATCKRKAAPERSASA